MLHLTGSVELVLSSVGSHFPLSISAEKGLFQVLELDVFLAVIVVGRDYDLVPLDEDLADEVVEHLVVHVDGVDRGLGKPLVERSD